MPAPTSAAAVANEFLDIQSVDPGFPPIDQMKIQKLVFYSHAWYLGLESVPLFEEDVYAWPWGPVVPPIYHDFLEFGRRPIAGKRASELVKAGPGNLEFKFIIPSVADAGLKTFLRQVWDAHKRFTGVQLSNATHATGEPWTIIREKYGNLDSKPLIPNDLIQEVFAKKAKAVAHAAVPANPGA